MSERARVRPKARKPNAPAIRTNVRESPSSFVGRQRELDSVAARFREGARLVTIVAIGGMGKTRLAARFAAREASAYSIHGGGGAWFSDLSDARSESDVVSVVGAVIGVPSDAHASDREAAEAVGRAIASRKRVLVVLDNFEGVATAAREALAGWIRAAPEAHFLVTSRVVVGIPGEHVEPLLPLPTATSRGDEGDLAGVEGVALFVSRARERDPRFAPTRDDLALVRSVVERVDAIPLAIELAAARISVLSLSEIAARLASPLDLLVRGEGGGKHGSMRRAIGDSFEQLADAERAAFVGVGVFRGRFSRAAAQEVLEASVSGADVLGLLEKLVACSLVCVSRGPGGVRFSLYESMREFAREELARDPGFARRIAERHARYYASAPSEIADEDFEDAFEAHRVWLGVASDEPDRQRLAELALAVERTAAHRGRTRLRFDVVDATLRALDDAKIDLAPLLVARGQASREMGMLDAARADFEQALARSRETKDETTEVIALLRLAELTETLGDTRTAAARVDDALAVLARIPEGPPRRRREAEAFARIGHIHRREGTLEKAEAETARAVTLYRSIDPGEELPLVLYEAAVIALFRKRYDVAKTRFDEGLALVSSSAPESGGGRIAEGALESGRGILLQELGDLAGAIGHHARAVQVFRSLGNRHREGSALYYLGTAYLESSALDEAGHILRESLDIVRSIGVPRYEALAAGALATLAAWRSDSISARSMFDSARRSASRCPSEGALAATLAIHELSIGETATLSDHSLHLRAQNLADSYDCDDPRLAFRVFEVRASEHDRSANDRRWRDQKARLVVARDGSSFELPAERRKVDLSKRVALRRILLALAKRRQEAPGAPLSQREIIEAGWPDERISHAAAVNRVQVALTTLRKMGLRDVILAGEGGYSLRPSMPLLIV